MNMSIVIQLKGSKSISNRLLLINHLYEELLSFENLSTSKDTQVMQTALSSKESTIDIHHAGTAMRFLTAYFSIQEGREVILTGSERMQERPIGVLVEALRELGAEIEYLKNKNYPPLKISGKKLEGGQLKINGGISSQFLSALLLIGSRLPKGLQLIPEGKIVSLPYLEMTIKMQNRLGIDTKIENEGIVVPFKENIEKRLFFVESDWSSASYLYETLSLGIRNKAEIEFLESNSLQADAVIPNLFEQFFGIHSVFEGKKVKLSKIEDFIFPKKIEIDCWNFPDIAQTLCITAVGHQIPIRLNGLDTLTIKETDRIGALKKELHKMGIEVQTTQNSLQILEYHNFNSNPYIEIETYNDHRMAMAFAPLLQKVSFGIKNKEVVEKSYPEFWDDFKKLADLNQ